MNSRHVEPAMRWVLAFGALAGIVLAYRRWVHVNPTTVALTLVLFVLLLAARWGLRYAVAVSLVATACYNYFFLPPLDTFTIADPQNWVALLAFLATGIVGSHLSQRARDEAEQARARQREMEVLFTLSRELLQTDNVAELVNSVPALINTAARAQEVVLYLLDGDRLYQDGIAGIAGISGIEIPHFRQLALSLQAPEITPDGKAQVPLRAGVRPRGLLVLTGLRLPTDTLQAIGGLVSIALDRAQALEEVSRGEATRESERLRTLILDSITHELRTPLTSIKGAASKLLAFQAGSPENTGSSGTSDPRRELLTLVEEEADRLNRLVGHAVEMAQIESQEVHMSFASVGVRDLVARARESCAAVVNTQRVNVSIPALPNVEADPEMVGKVLCNLLENAAKYSKADAPIFVTAEEKDGFVFTSVADRGIGIDPAEQSLIFDRLYRSSKTIGRTPGTGMGLAISRAIIDSHHGSLTVTSQPEHGSVFTFSLPVAERKS